MLQGRIVDILVVLMDEIHSRGMENNRMELISTELLKKGYSEKEISTAFSWILERMVYSNSNAAPNPHSYRILHDVEKLFISQEAYGFLLQLEMIGLLSHEELERVIESALMESTPGLSVEKIKSLVAETIFGQNEALLPGNDLVVPEDFIH